MANYMQKQFCQLFPEIAVDDLQLRTRDIECLMNQRRLKTEYYTKTIIKSLAIRVVSEIGYLQRES